MNFTSPVFLLYFFPLVLVLYFFLREDKRNILLIIASGLFYFWGEGLYVLLIYLWIILNFFTSLAISMQEKKDSKRASLILAIILNLGVLAYFKYTNFIFGNLNIVGIDNKTFNIYLPLAISFFTFHAISYNIDVFKGVNKPEKNLARLVLYFTLFPHLIAGPIIRYHQVAKKLIKRAIDWQMVSQGLYRFMIGLSKKVIIANTLAPVADEVFSIGPAHVSIEQIWIAVICFALQIYYDFSGYTDMAIGLGMIFGFKFPENFNYPYTATSIIDFWRRWHMTLYNWFKDYVYIPLGGNRKGEIVTFRNIILVFALTGLWHGANWTFIAWGLFHGIFLVLERLKGGFFINWMPKLVKHVYTLLVLLISWVFFRSESLTESAGFIKLMFNNLNQDLIYYSTDYFVRNDIILALILGLFFATPIFSMFLTYIKRTKISVIPSEVFRLLAFTFLFLLSLIFISAETYQSFIYFRF